MTATIVFGVVPATLALLANALYYVKGLTAIPEGVTVNVAWGEIVFLVLIGAAGLLGYAALLFAAADRVSGKVVIGLLIGAVALASAIWLGLASYWLATPLIVAAAHIAAYWLRRDRAPAIKRTETRA
jgi:hypothetical protein